MARWFLFIVYPPHSTSRTRLQHLLRHHPNSRNGLVQLRPIVAIGRWYVCPHGCYHVARLLLVSGKSTSRDGFVMQAAF